MPTLSLLFVALFLATVRAAVPSFGHNIVPYIPQVSPFRPVYISWAALIILPVILLRLERPIRPAAKPHHRPMRHHKYQVEQSRCSRVRDAPILAMFVHLSTSLLHSPNPVSPYKLLVHTSYVPTASHVHTTRS